MRMEAPTSSYERSNSLDYKQAETAEPCTGKNLTTRFHSLSLLSGKNTKRVSAAMDMEQPLDKANTIYKEQSDEAPSDETMSSSESIFRPDAISANAGGRRNRQYGANRLPTLDESDSSELDSSFDDEQLDPDSLSPPRISASAAAIDSSTSDNSGGHSAITSSTRTKDKLQLFTANQLSSCSSAAPSHSNRPISSSSSKGAAAAAAATPTITVRDRIAALVARADEYAAYGRDEAAFTQYRAGLKLTRIETAKIKQQLKKVDGKHPTTIQSIHSRLHEDWLDVGKCIAEIRQKMAIMCERCGDYPKALSCCKEAKEVLERHQAFLSKRSKKYTDRLHQTSERIKEIDALLEKMKLSLGSFDDRKAMHEQIIMMRKQIDAEHDPKKRQDLLTMTTLKVQKALQTETRVLGLRHPQIADTLSLLATLAYERGMMESSREFMREAIEIALEVLGDMHPTTGEMFLQAARIYTSQDEQRAIDYYSRAVAIFREGNMQSTTGSALNEMATLQIRQKRYAEAMTLLNEALEACHSLSESDYNEITAQIHRNLGECYSSLKDHNKAVASYVRAVDLQRDCKKDGELHMGESFQNFGEMMDEEGFADTLRRLGKCYMYCGRHAEALVAYGEALSIHRSHVMCAAHPGRPSSALPERQDQLAHTLFCIAEVKETVGGLEEALTLYSESMQLRMFSDAHRAEKRLNMVHCAMCLRGIGNVHMAKQEYDAAKKILEDALQYCDAHGLSKAHVIRCTINKQLADASKLAEDHVGEQKSDKDEFNSAARSPNQKRSASSPFPATDQRKLADDIAELEWKSAKFIDCDDDVNAIESLTKLMASRKALLKLLKAYDRDASNEKYETACTLLTFGKVLLKNGDPVNAERALEDSLKLFRKSRSARDLQGVKDAQLALKALNGVQL